MAGMAGIAEKSGKSGRIFFFWPLFVTILHRFFGVGGLFVVLAGALRWSSTAVTGGRVMPVGWRWEVGRAVVFFWRWCGWVWGWVVIGWLRCCDGWVFLLGGIIARIWGVFCAILGNFLIGWGGGLVLGLVVLWVMG